VTSIVPVTFSVASSMTKIRFGQPPMYSVPLPPVSLAGAGGSLVLRRTDDHEQGRQEPARLPECA
jgi:hypothetical protein